MAYCVLVSSSLWLGNGEGVSFPSCHDFQVLQCIVSRVGSSSVYVLSEAMAHCDWLRGQFYQTLTEAAEAALLWKQKHRTVDQKSII